MVTSEALASWYLSRKCVKRGVDGRSGRGQLHRRTEELSLDLEHTPHAPCRGARRAVQAPRVVRHVPFPRGRARGLPRERMHEQLEPRRRRAAGTPLAPGPDQLLPHTPPTRPHAHTPTRPHPLAPLEPHTPGRRCCEVHPLTPPLCRSSRTGAPGPSPVASPYSLPSAFLCSTLTTRAAALPPGRAG